MEHNDQRQRQSNPPSYAGQQGLVHTSPQYTSAGASDRFRQAPLTAQSPTSAPSAGRTGSVPGYNYVYAESAQFGGSAIQAGALQYQPDYAQDTQRTQQQYTQYGSNMMYNVPQQPQPAQQSPYESVQPYPPRQSAAIEVLSNQFGVPPQYYVDSGPNNAPTTVIATQSVPSQYSPLSYTAQNPVGRVSQVPGFATGMADTGQTSTQAGFAQTILHPHNPDDMANAYASYQAEVRKVFEHVRDGRLSEGGELVMQISEWLLGNAEHLVRDPDDQETHNERLRLWNEFNTCWLALLQKQKDMTQEMLDMGQRPHPPQVLLDPEFMENMGKELVRLCDLIEKHGLVDYQMGVWEEDIIAVLTQCLDLLEPPDPPDSTSNPQQTPSSAPARRR